MRVYDRVSDCVCVCDICIIQEKAIMYKIPKSYLSLVIFDINIIA